jgi:hypothetical protein
MARQGGSVVGTGGDSELAGVEFLTRHISLGQDPCVFKVTISEAARRIGCGNDLTLDVLRKGASPEEGRMVGREQDTTHASFGGVDRTQNARMVRNYLGKVGGSFQQAVGQLFEVIQVVTDVLGDSNPVLGGITEAEVEGAEEARATGDGDRHEPELTNDLLPLPQADAALAPECRELGQEAEAAVFRELNGLEDRVQDPSQDEFACAPCCIAF